MTEPHILSEPPRVSELPPADHAARRERLRRRLIAEELPAMVVTGAANVRYLTGFTGTNGQLLLDEERAVLVTDGRYEERAAVEAPGLDLLLDRQWLDRAVGFAADAGLVKLAFEDEHVNHRTGMDLMARLRERRVRGVPVPGVVEALRAVKDEHEIAALRTACGITCQAYDALLGRLRPGRTEREIATELERTMVDLGAEAPAFPSIVAGGPNSAVPHHAPTDRPVAADEPLKLDFGARFAGYHADMTRTVFLGDPGRHLRAVYGHVRAAQEAGVLAAVAGASGGDVDAACRDLLGSVGLAKWFVHGTGHGVGLEIHEAPSVAQGSTATLRAGTAVTVEPGVYLPGEGGVRIEDTVVIRVDGPPERLTTSPRELTSL